MCISQLSSMCFVAFHFQVRCIVFTNCTVAERIIENSGGSMAHKSLKGAQTQCQLNFLCHFLSLLWLSNACMIHRRNVHVVHLCPDAARETWCSNSLSSKLASSHVYRHVFYRGQIILLKLTFKATFFIYKLSLNTNQQCFVFLPSDFV
jgi:hypothetical protein